MKLRWPWSKQEIPMPEIMVGIDYFLQANTITVRHFPPDIDANQVAGLLFYTAEAIDANGMVELNNTNDIVDFILHPTTEKPKLRLVK